MAALPQLMSVEQFRQLPDGEYQYELHHGEVVAVAMPKHWHVNLRHQLFRLLRSRLESFGEVATEVPYRPFPEFDMRVADVAAVPSPLNTVTDLRTSSTIRTSNWRLAILATRRAEARSTWHRGVLVGRASARLR
jgi:hypothetical protein